MLPANADRFASSDLVPESGRPTGAGRLVVVSNRVADLSANSQPGGLAVALGEALAASGGIWFG